jgi:hypothetical protein
MKAHLVRMRRPQCEMQFQFIRSALPGLEEMLVSVINRFYDLTGDIYSGVAVPAVYTVHLDAKGGNNFQKQDQIHFNPHNLTEWTVTHELAHSLDSAHGWRLSRMMRERTGSGYPFKILHHLRPTWKLFWYRVGSPPPPCGIDKNFNALEDFAETVTAYIFPEEAHQRAEARGHPYEKWGYGHFHFTPRGNFIASLLNPEIQTALLS